MATGIMCEPHSWYSSHCIKTLLASPVSSFTCSTQTIARKPCSRVHSWYSTTPSTPLCRSWSTLFWSKTYLKRLWWVTQGCTDKTGVMHWCPIHYLVKWILPGVWHSLVSFFMRIFLYDELQESDRDFRSLQTVVAQTVVFIVNFKVIFYSKHWNGILFLSVVLSSLSYCLFTFAFHFFFPYDNFLVDSAYYLVYTDLLADPSMWLCTVITVVIALLPDFLIQVFNDSKYQNKPKYNKTVPFVDPVI